MPEIRFGIQHAPHRSPPVSSQRMDNCYLETAPAASRAPVAVVPSYGISNFTSNLTGVKGANVINDVVYAQTSTGLYSVDSKGAEKLLGTLATTEQAIIEGDGINIVVVTNELGYYWDGTSITSITDTDSDFPAALWMGYLDGFFPTIESGTGKLWINTTTFTPGAWDPLDFATAEGNPDDLLWGIVDQREIILFGHQSTEFWYNKGLADFPFSRSPNGYIEIGIMSSYAAGKLATGVFFMGHDGIAYQLGGYTPQRISTHAMEQAVEGYTKNCRVLTWHEGGHGMVAFRFPEGCWVYDLATQLWHTRSTYPRSTWNVNVTLNAYDKYLVVSSDNTNQIGKFDSSVFTEFGDIQRMEVQSASVSDGNNEIPHDRLELVFETGNAGTVMLRFSDNGGRTWSNERQKTLGALGNYDTRVIFGNLGRARDRVYELSMSDANRRTLLSAQLNEWG